MDFARKLLIKHGWREGQGLGKTESGIAAPIRPNLKFDCKGIGYQDKSILQHNWWDQLYNRTAKGLTIGSNKKKEDEVEQQVKQEDISSEQKKIVNLNKGLIYRKFEKGAVLKGNTEVSCSPKDKSSLSEDNYSTHLTDHQLFELCEGRTAHKGARHGITMSAKLARVAEQDLVMLGKLQKPLQVKTEKKRKRYSGIVPSSYPELAAEDSSFALNDYNTSYHKALDRSLEAITHMKKKKKLKVKKVFTNAVYKPTHFVTNDNDVVLEKNLNNLHNNMKKKREGFKNGTSTNTNM